MRTLSLGTTLLPDALPAMFTTVAATATLAGTLDMSFSSNNCALPDD